MTNKKENVNNQLNFNFLKNSVKGLESSQKHVIMFEHFKNIIGHRAILFLQEIYSSIATENNGMTILRVNHTT